MCKKGVRFTAAWGRQAFNIGGRSILGRTHGRGGGRRARAGGVAQNIARKNGIDLYEARALDLLYEMMASRECA